MKKKRVLSWILSLALALSVFNIPLAGVYAEEEEAVAGIDVDSLVIQMNNEEGQFEDFGSETYDIPFFYEEVEPFTRYLQVRYESSGESKYFEDQDFEGNAEITWESDSPEVVSVEDGGSPYMADLIIYPVEGTAKITVTYDPDRDDDSDEGVITESFQVKIFWYGETSDTIFSDGVYYNASQYKDTSGEMSYSASVIGVAEGWNGSIAASVKDSVGVVYPVTKISSLFTRTNVTPAAHEKAALEKVAFEEDTLEEAALDMYGYNVDHNTGAYYYTSTTSVKSITIPASVTSLEAGAFCDIKGLTDITVVPENKNYYSVDGVLFARGKNEIGNSQFIRVVKDAYGRPVLDANGQQQLVGTAAALVYYPRARTAKRYVIPDGVQITADNYAFDGVGKSALKTIVLPASFDIAQYTFWNSGKGTTYNSSLFSSFKSTEDGMFTAWNIKVLTKGDMTAMQAHANGYIDDKTGTTALPYGKYIDYKNAKNVAVKVKGVTFIVNTTDEGLATIVSVKKNKKKTIKVPAKVTIDGLKYSVVTINGKAFKKCKKAKKVVVPAGVTLIKKRAFTKMPKLKTIQFKTKKNSITMKKGAFKGVKKSVVVKVPKKMKKAQLKKFKRAVKKAGFKGTVKKK